jgi:hypothetical protein
MHYFLTDNEGYQEASKKNAFCNDGSQSRHFLFCEFSTAPTKNRSMNQYQKPFVGRLGIFRFDGVSAVYF